MTTLPPDPMLVGFIKPTLDTPFHIDVSWWEKSGLDFNIELLSHLCPEHREAYMGRPPGEKIDWIDKMTGEVRQVAGLEYVIHLHCSKRTDYVTQAPTLMEAVFRVFLSNENAPMTPRQLAPIVGYPAKQILQVLSGHQVRKGLRPIMTL